MNGVAIAVVMSPIPMSSADAKDREVERRPQRIGIAVRTSNAIAALPASP